MVVDDYLIPVAKQEQQAEERIRLDGEESDPSEGSVEADQGRTVCPEDQYSSLSAYKGQSRNRSKELERPKTPVANSLTINEELRRMEKNIAKTNYMTMYRASIGADDVRKTFFPERDLAQEIRARQTRNVQAD